MGCKITFADFGEYVKCLSIPGAAVDEEGNVLNCNLIFDNCYLRIGKGTELFVPANPFNLKFKNCTIVQHDKFYDATNKIVGYWDGEAVVGVNYKLWGLIGANSWLNLYIEDCNISTWGRIVYLHNNGSTFANNPNTPQNSIVSIKNNNVVINDLDAFKTNISATDSNNPRCLVFIKHDNDGTKHNISYIENNISPQGIQFVSGTENRRKGISVPAAQAYLVFSKGVPLGFTYFNTTFNANMTVITVGVEVNSVSKRVWRNNITGKTYEDDNTEFPSAAYASELDSITTGFVYYNTTVNAFVECTEISGGTPTWARKATAEIIDPGSDPIPENGGQQQAELNP